MSGARPEPSLVGYADPWSVAAGETVRFMVSSDHPRYRAELVRLLHGDGRPGAPGLKEERVGCPVDGGYPGVAQPYRTGSAVVVPDAPALRLDSSFTLTAWICPTTPGKGPQGLLTKWSERDGLGYGLVIDADGAIALWLGASGREPQRLSSGTPLRAGQWYLVAAAYDAGRGSVTLVQHPFPRWPVDDTAAVVEHRAAPAVVDDGGAPFVMAAWWSGPGVGVPGTRGHYNGRIEAPAVYACALSPDALAALAADAGDPDTVDPAAGGPAAHDPAAGDPAAVAPAAISADAATAAAGIAAAAAAGIAAAATAAAGIGPIAAWDFSVDTTTDRIRDVAGGGLDGRTVNLPARAMCGHRYRAGEPAWTRAPQTHAALHFHDDDLEDCGWDVAAELTVPDALPSGVYALKLTAEGATYRVPFFVRPPGRRAAAPVLLLMPTNSYLAYANFREPFARDSGVLGHYHEHADGSPVFYSSARRPIVNMQPTALFDVLGEAGAPHQLAADLYLVDWLTAQGFAFDVATDADLDGEGLELLAQYRVVLTGSHPEYWSGPMLDALGSYLDRGGRLMYLGGNGLTWNAALHPQRRHVVEVRRDGGDSRAAAPGEQHHSTTGDKGGSWRVRGRAPNRLVGVGSIAQGFDRSVPYRRAPGSRDPRAAWIFERVADDEPIGEFGLTMGGAAGFEVDCADAAYGTPPHALVLATATGFPASYEHQYAVHVAGTGADPPASIRSDIVFFETPGGGAVFSVGSIAYVGALSHDGYCNNVSRITANVLRRFMGR